MAKIEIEWLSVSVDCEQCGGNYADGAQVRIDGIVPDELDLAPVAACFDGQHYSQEDVYKRILEFLGHTVESET